MKEFMNELGKKVNEVAEQLGKRTEPIVKKTEEVVEIQKIKGQIRAMEMENEYDLADLGEIVYAKYLDGLVEDEDFVAICKEIGERLLIIEAMEKYLAELKGIEICPECDAELMKDAEFCSRCGAKVEHLVEDEEEEDAEDDSEAISEEIFEEGDVVEVIETEDAEIEIELIVEAEVELEDGEVVE